MGSEKCIRDRKEDLQKLRALNGKEITFSGILLKFEGFAKEVYLTSGKLV